MRENSYQKFSFAFHKKNWLRKIPNVCQFELTFKCGLHCRHCYTDCFNNPIYTKKELNTEQIKFILDKLYQRGIIWCCFTGGDPLLRDDFLDIYSYAKSKGFIIIIFSNAFSLTEEIINYFKNSPPFVLEITINGVIEEIYEKISQVKGSYKQVMKNIELILSKKVPLKIKTKITKDNFDEFHKIEEFVKKLGLEFYPTFDLHPRLDGDCSPCRLRITAKQAHPLFVIDNHDCKFSTEDDFENDDGKLFKCAIAGGDGIHIDPYGNMFLCNLIRKPSLNILKEDIQSAQERLLSTVLNRKFKTDSRCNGCDKRRLCFWCPARALLEMGDEEYAIPYHCSLVYGSIIKGEDIPPIQF